MKKLWHDHQPERTVSLRRAKSGRTTPFQLPLGSGILLKFLKTDRDSVFNCSVLWHDFTPRIGASRYMRSTDDQNSDNFP